MKNSVLKRLSLTVTIIAIVNLIASFIFIFTLPDTVPTHFNISLVCDNVGSKWSGIIVPVIIALVFPLCMLFEGKGKNSEINPKPLAIIIVFAEIMITTLCWFLLLAMKSGVTIGDRIPFNLEFLITLTISLMFVVIGNYLPTVRQNKTLGIKIPWTLKNEKCWDATHRFSGKVWVIIGIIMLITAFTIKLSGTTSFIPYIILLLATPLISVIIPTIYAYNHRND